MSKVTFALVGALAGQTVKLGSKTNPFRFTNGKMTLSAGDADKVGPMLARSYSAHREGPLADAAQLAYEEAVGHAPNREAPGSELEGQDASSGPDEQGPAEGSDKADGKSAVGPEGKAEGVATSAPDGQGPKAPVSSPAAKPAATPAKIVDKGATVAAKPAAPAAKTRVEAPPPAKSE